VPDSLTVIRGQVFCPDSLPVEDAYLISYNTLRAYATDKKGKFSISVNITDSLKVHHVSFESIVLKPKLEYQKVYLKFRDNALSEIIVKNNDREVENMQNNFELMKIQLSGEYQYNFQPAGVVVNSYAPQKEANGIAETNIIEFMKFIKRKIED
jgi:hypothetical protein